MIKKFIAFTLSEVLMVAAIVGVIAALTVPNLKKSHDDKAMVAKGKSAMAKLDAAIQQVNMADVLSKNTTNDASLELLNQMADYLKLLSNCGKITSNNYCFTKNTITNGSTLNSYSNHTENSKCSSAILNDGTEFAVCIVSKTPVTESTAFSNNQKFYGYIVADVNGANQEPNTRARDVYYYLITENGSLAIPDGTSQTSYEMKTFKEVF